MTMTIRPGDLLEQRCPRFGVMFQWKVESVCLGSVGQESVIGVSSVGIKQGVGTDGVNRIMWVPEPMTRHLSVFRPDDT